MSTFLDSYFIYISIAHILVIFFLIDMISLFIIISYFTVFKALFEYLKHIKTYALQL